MSLQAMSVSLDRLMSNSFEGLSPGARHLLRHLAANTPGAIEREREFMLSLNRDMEDAKGDIISSSLQEINDVLSELIGNSSPASSPTVVSSDADGFSCLSDPILPPEHHSGLLSGQMPRSLADELELPFEDDMDLNAIDTALPFDIHDAHSSSSTATAVPSWPANSRASQEAAAPSSAGQNLFGTSPVGDNYFLNFVPSDSLIADLMNTDVLPHPLDMDSPTDSAYHSKPASPKHAKASRKQPAASKPSAQEESKRRKQSPKTAARTAANSRRTSSSSVAADVKASGQYRGMSQRDAHNAMERERRIQLRENFESLRAEVPALCDVDKAATLSILREATAYIEKIKAEEQALMQQKAQLLAENERLRRSATLLHHHDDSDVPPLMAPPS
eukprot:TRINITY_DN6538_c0_g1_i1.p1 TRINITY_DN6538_c0_g1~~TRINITY_DN6538_c0_g1_i1.p1  ORF type:complete len:390 (+),score=121.09 TRINITY_DN6538_c0_g1_i1:290-1459(+)